LTTGRGLPYEYDIAVLTPHALYHLEAASRLSTMWKRFWRRKGRPSTLISLSRNRAAKGVQTPGATWPAPVRSLGECVHRIDPTGRRLWRKRWKIWPSVNRESRNHSV
jgi:hypothetical protein